MRSTSDVTETSTFRTARSAVVSCADRQQRRQPELACSGADRCTRRAVYGGRVEHARRRHAARDLLQPDTPTAALATGVDVPRAASGRSGSGVQLTPDGKSHAGQQGPRGRALGDHALRRRRRDRHRLPRRRGANRASCGASRPAAAAATSTWRAPAPTPARRVRARPTSGRRSANGSPRRSSRRRRCRDLARQRGLASSWRGTSRSQGGVTASPWCAGVHIGS